MYEDALLDVIFGKMTAKEAYESRMGDKGRTTEERMLYREKMCEAVEQYLKKEKMFYWYDKENCTFSSKTEMEGMIRCCDILIMIDEDTICTKTYLPVQADMDARETVDELLIRINEKLGFERFKIDYDSGEVWHEAFFFYDGEKLPSEKRMDEIFWTGVSRIRVFGEILMSAMLGYVDSVDKVLQEVMDNIAE